MFREFIFVNAIEMHTLTAVVMQKAVFGNINYKSIKFISISINKCYIKLK